MKVKHVIPTILIIFACGDRKSDEIIGEWIEQSNKQVNFIFSDNSLAIRGSNIDDNYNWTISSDTLIIEQSRGRKEKIYFLITFSNKEKITLRLQNFLSFGFSDENINLIKKVVNN